MAVPGSGTISLTGLAGEKHNNDFGDADFDDVISLTDLVLGGNENGSHESWEATNANSSEKPDTSAPHAMSEWYGYDHDAAAAFVNAKAVSKSLATGSSNAITFDDTDDTFNFTESDAFSISMWVKAGWSSSLNTNIHFLIGIKQNATRQAEELVKIYYDESQNRLSVRIGNRTPSNTLGWYSQAQWLFHANSGQYAAGYAAAGLGSTFWSASNRGYVNSDNYTMITVTKSSSNSASAMKLYWNANNAGAPPITYTSGSGSPAMSTTNNRTWSVGSNGVANGETKTGNSSATVYNDLTIWNKELSASEVTELYNSGTVMDATTHSAQSNLVGYWKWEGNGNATRSNDNFTISGSSAIVNK